MAGEKCQQGQLSLPFDSACIERISAPRKQPPDAHLDAHIVRFVDATTKELRRQAAERVRERGVFSLEQPLT
jgi:hypothetical protein